jgi:hypothetical protein
MTATQSLRLLCRFRFWILSLPIRQPGFGRGFSGIDCQAKRLSHRAPLPNAGESAVGLSATDAYGHSLDSEACCAQCRKSAGFLTKILSRESCGVSSPPGMAAIMALARHSTPWGASAPNSTAAISLLACPSCCGARSVLSGSWSIHRFPSGRLWCTPIIWRSKQKLYARSPQAGLLVRGIRRRSLLGLSLKLLPPSKNGQRRTMFPARRPSAAWSSLG